MSSLAFECLGGSAPLRAPLHTAVPPGNRSRNAAVTPVATFSAYRGHQLRVMPVRCCDETHILLILARPRATRLFCVPRVFISNDSGKSAVGYLSGTSCAEAIGRTYIGVHSTSEPPPRNSFTMTRPLRPHSEVLRLASPFSAALFPFVSSIPRSFPWTMV